jgi:hypothetical protein
VSRRAATGPILGLLGPLLLAAPACAQGDPPRLGLPVDCTPGEDCWVALYFDHDSGEGVRDYACGTLTYDGHGGTDFAVRDLLAVADGVAVLAAAEGVVRAVRDGMPDVNVEAIGPAAVEGRECGNGVLIDHGGDLTTQYCHLRQGSVRVERGERVEAGQPLGYVGMSGMASFPHVELTVRHRDRKVDPFVGIEGGPDCAVGDEPLWDEDALAALLPYEPLLLTGAGFAPFAPEAEQVRAGLHRDGSLPRTSPALVLWVEVYGVREGDAVTFRIDDPDGATLIDERQEFGRDWARWFGYGGKRRPGIVWQAGQYRGEVVVERPAADGGAPRRFAVARAVELR